MSTVNHVTSTVSELFTYLKVFPSLGKQEISITTVLPI